MKLYLAGPDVFRPDATAFGEALKRLCARYGFQGLFPLDTPATKGDGPAVARAIFDANLALLEQADAVLANLGSFRGDEPDSGTAFEVGYAIARGKPVWAYAGHADTLARRLGTGRDAEGRAIDAQGWLVEDFGLNLNLMLACSATVVHGDAETCLRQMAATLFTDKR